MSDNAPKGSKRFVLMNCQEIGIIYNNSSGGSDVVDEPRIQVSNFESTCVRYMAYAVKWKSL